MSVQPILRFFKPLQNWQEETNSANNDRDYWLEMVSEIDEKCSCNCKSIAQCKRLYCFLVIGAKILKKNNLNNVLAILGKKLLLFNCATFRRSLSMLYIEYFQRFFKIFLKIIGAAKSILFPLGEPPNAFEKGAKNCLF